MLMLVPVLVWNSAVASPIQAQLPPMPNLIVPGFALASAISSPHGFDAEIVPRHQDHRAGGDFGHRRKLPQIDRVVRMDRLGDERTRRDEIERVPVSGRAGQFAGGEDEVAAGLVLHHDGRLHVLRHLLRHQPCLDVGAAAGRKADDHAGRPARKVLHASAARGASAAHRKAVGRTIVEKCRCVLPEFLRLDVGVLGDLGVDR